MGAAKRVMCLSEGRSNNALVSHARPNAGFTLIELLVVLAIFGLLASLGGWSYLSTRNPPRDAARAVHSALFTLRSGAMSNTQARRMVLVDGGKTLALQSALSCAEADQSKWTAVGTVPLDSGNRPLTLTAGGALLPGTTGRLVVCFTPRGLASTAGSLRISGTSQAYLVEVALGGGVRTSAAP